MSNKCIVTTCTQPATESIEYADVVQLFCKGHSDAYVGTMLTQLGISAKSLEHIKDNVKITKLEPSE